MLPAMTPARPANPPEPSALPEALAKRLDAELARCHARLRRALGEWLAGRDGAGAAPGAALARRRAEIRAAVRSLEARLAPDQEIGVLLGGFAHLPPLRLRAVIFHDSGAVSFVGMDNAGQPANLYHEAGPMNLLLRRVPRRHRRAPRRPVGFYRAHLSAEEDGAQGD